MQGLRGTLAVAAAVGALGLVGPARHRRGARIVLLGVDWLMLGVVLYHGLNGVRTFAHDYLSGPGAQQAVDWALWIAGLVLLVYGGWGLAAFVR